MDQSKGYEATKKQIEKIIQDVESVTVQGATNVALATLEGMKLASGLNTEHPLEDVESVGYEISNARDNEPLARNAVRYILSSLRGDNIQEEVQKAIEEFKDLLDQAKTEIKKYAADQLRQYDVVLTHCHSSTATAALIAAAKKNPNLKVVSTETRPLYQGRKTARELVEAGVDTTMIVDSASASFIVDDRYLPVEAAIIGCDELHVGGSAINKVGSYQIGLATKEGNDELYIVTSLLKLDPKINSQIPNIEMRAAREVWEEAPEELKIINPAFEIVPAELITGYITEAGVLKQKELESRLYELYHWME